jgi:predicted DNA-binding transcriptional regulator AlpA
MPDNSPTTNSEAQLRPLPTELIGPSELARRLGCSRQGVYLMARRPWFPRSMRFGVRSQRWDWPAVVAAVQEHSSQIAEQVRADSKVAAAAGRKGAEGRWASRGELT